MYLLSLLNKSISLPNKSINKKYKLLITSINKKKKKFY